MKIVIGKEKKVEKKEKEKIIKKYTDIPHDDHDCFYAGWSVYYKEEKDKIIIYLECIDDDFCKIIEVIK